LLTEEVKLCVRGEDGGERASARAAHHAAHYWVVGHGC
jgi:hypothetical protein